MITWPLRTRARCRRGEGHVQLSTACSLTVCIFVINSRRRRACGFVQIILFCWEKWNILHNLICWFIKETLLLPFIRSVRVTFGCHFSRITWILIFWFCIFDFRLLLFSKINFSVWFILWTCKIEIVRPLAKLLFASKRRGRSLKS